MNFDEFTDYTDFCKKKGISGKEAIDFLKRELEKKQGERQDGRQTS